MSENLWLLAGMGVLVAFGSALLWLTTKMAKRLELALERGLAAPAAGRPERAS